MGYRGRHRERTGHPVLRAVAVSTVMVLLAVAGVVFLTYRHLEGNIQVSDGFDEVRRIRPEQVMTGGPTEPLNILVLGSDTRTGQSDVPGQTPGLSDTTILLHLSADRERAYGVSIPRDLMVRRPACRDIATGKMAPPADTAQWNEAYALGREACTIAQFEAMTDIRLDHFVVVDFAGFKAMVDALGGVPVCVPTEVDDPIGRIYLPAGTYEVTGNQALDYVRVRHEISNNGDIGRMRRQQAFLASMVNKAISAGTLVNLPRLLGFLDAATKSVTTDPGLSQLTDLANLAFQVRGIGLDKVQFFTVPFTTYEPDPNRLAPGEDADRLWRRLRHDQRLGPRFTAGAAKASEGRPGAKGGGSKGGGSKADPEPADPEQQQDRSQNGLCT